MTPGQLIELAHQEIRHKLGLRSGMGSAEGVRTPDPRSSLRRNHPFVSTPSRPFSSLHPSVHSIHPIHPIYPIYPHLLYTARNVLSLA